MNKIFALVDCEEEIKLLTNIGVKAIFFKCYAHLYAGTLDNFSYCLISYNKTKRENFKYLEDLAGSFDRNKIFVFQPEPGREHKLNFLQYFPMKRYKEEEFLALKLWEDCHEQKRNGLRFKLIIPIEIKVQNNIYLKTYATDISGNGAKIVYSGPQIGESVYLRMKDGPEFKSHVVWNSQWDYGKVPEMGVRFSKKADFSLLNNFLKEKIIPKVT